MAKDNVVDFKTPQNVDPSVKIYLLATMGKEYIGKLSEDQSSYWLIDVIQVIPFMSQRGDVSLVGYPVGSIKGDHIDTDYLLIELTKNSPHWETYFSTSSGLKLA